MAVEVEGERERTDMNGVQDVALLELGDLATGD